MTQGSTVGMPHDTEGREDAPVLVTEEMIGHPEAGR